MADLKSVDSDSISSFVNIESDIKTYKVICVGESGVGKTSLIQRYMQDTFVEHQSQPTLGCDFKVKLITVSDSNRTMVQPNQSNWSIVPPG